MEAGNSRQASQKESQETIAPASAGTNDSASLDSSAEIGVLSLVSGDDSTPQSQFGYLLHGHAPLVRASTNAAELQPDDVLETAFEQIGGSDYALLASSADHRIWLNSWISGMPLLLMFALERVATRNSRQRRASEGTIEAVRRRAT
jgi:hypothetical protein